MPSLVVHGLAGVSAVGDPRVARDYVYVDDVVEAYCLAARQTTSRGACTTWEPACRRPWLKSGAAGPDGLPPSRRACLGLDAQPVLGHRHLAGELPENPGETRLATAVHLETGFRRFLDWFRSDPQRPATTGGSCRCRTIGGRRHQTAAAADGLGDRGLCRLDAVSTILPCWFGFLPGRRPFPFSIILLPLMNWSRHDWLKAARCPKQERWFAVAVLFLAGVFGLLLARGGELQPRPTLSFSHRALVQLDCLSRPFLLTETAKPPRRLPQISRLHVMTSYRAGRGVDGPAAFGPTRWDVTRTAARFGRRMDVRGADALVPSIPAWPGGWPLRPRSSWRSSTWPPMCGGRDPTAISCRTAGTAKRPSGECCCRGASSWRCVS